MPKTSNALLVYCNRLKIIIKNLTGVFWLMQNSENITYFFIFGLGECNALPRFTLKTSNALPICWPSVGYLVFLPIRTDANAEGVFIWQLPLLSMDSGNETGAESDVFSASMIVITACG